ncbi:MAG TPA: methyltransferase [Candidatus Dormibacteraeota bacterium]|nr:methyltransferase [Candidatus Dormibacteraeota bacterium]
MIQPRDRLYDMISGYRVTQLVRAAALLRIPDALSRGPRQPADVALEVNADAGLLRRLMRALAGFGVLEELEDGRFSNTELGSLLREDAAGSMRSFAIGLSDQPWWKAWAELPSGLSGMTTPFQLALGRSFWEEASAGTATAERFNAYMAAGTGAFVPELLGAFDFAGCGHVVDVGSGKGALVAGILSAHRSMRATLFDRAEGFEDADAFLRERGVRDRCDIVTGSFFDSVPPSGDTYILRLILHDWPDEQAREILSNCRSAMQTGARLLVIDHILPERAVDAPRERRALMTDMHMHVLFGARERTEGELRQMLSGAGFEVERVVPTSPTSTVIARAA